jgi:hypothetical protein
MEVVSKAMTGEDDPTGMFILGTKAGTVHIFRGERTRELFGAVDTSDEALWILDQAGVKFEPCGSNAPWIEFVNGDPHRITILKPGAGLSCPSGGLESLPGDARVTYVVFPDGDHVLASSMPSLPASGCPVAGRRPAGLRREPCARAREELGTLFAREAHDEAASIIAFAQLERELAVHRAPPALVALAARARRDEQRHAHAMARLARRWGGRPIAPNVQRSELRSLGELALDNAVEGCVNETYSALRAAYQARVARDSACARVLRGVARDELRHAAFSWQLAGWAEQRLNEVERRRVREARRWALSTLQGHVPLTPSCAAHAQAGVPTPADTHKLVAGLSRVIGALIG